MPQGPLGGPRITEFGPFVGGECDVGARDSRTISRVVEDRLREKDELTSEEVIEVSGKLENMFGDLIGVGSGRMVFDLSDKCVLKVSKRWNPHQNKSEIHSYKNIL